jgi:hypothetical protein
MITWTPIPQRGKDKSMSRSVDLCDGYLPLAGLRRIALNAWSGGCSGYLFGFGGGFLRKLAG